MSKKMENWRALAQKLNEKMEGYLFHTLPFRVKTFVRVTLFLSYSL